MILRVLKILLAGLVLGVAVTAGLVVVLAVAAGFALLLLGRGALRGFGRKSASAAAPQRPAVSGDVIEVTAVEVPESRHE